MSLKTKLYAPEGYWKLTGEQREDLCNGCGPGKILGVLVPDTIWWLCITPACNIHDYMYVRGKTLDDKNEADRVFLNNMLRLVEAGTERRWLRRLRISRALVYYRAVSQLGGPWYWRGKNHSGEYRT